MVVDACAFAGSAFDFKIELIEWHPIVSIPYCARFVKFLPAHFNKLNIWEFS